MNKALNKVLNAVVVIVTALVVNGLCFLYYNPLHNSQFNSYRLDPGLTGFQAREGVSFSYSDERGFSNLALSLVDSGYVLCMGSSQTAGANVSPDERYSDVLNSMLGYGNELGVYNLGLSGGKFVDIVRNFRSLTEEFPDSELIVIEGGVLSPSVSESEYAKASDEISFNNSVTGEALADYGSGDKAVLFAKKSLPLALLYYTQFESWLEVEKADSVFAAEGTDRFEDCLSVLRESYDGKIVFIYHREIDPDIEIIDDESEVEALRNACEKYDIDVIDVVPAFEKHYLETYELPYGFNNSAMGKGHLNATGHKLIAEAIYSYMEDNL